MPQTLLLNGNYQVLQFVSERKALSMLINQKVEVLSEWNLAFGKLVLPAVMRLNYIIKRPPFKQKFNRYAVFRRDRYTCQYCGKALTGCSVTLDHVVPRKFGGGNNFLNCVSSCYPCNNGKGARTPEQAGLKLMRKPFVPVTNFIPGPSQTNWHESWRFYLPESHDQNI